MKVLLKSVLSLAIAAAFTGQAVAADIVDTAVSAGKFKTLAAALGATDLVPVLKGDGPFTVFAPTDAAFDALPPGTVETLLKPENKEKLASILTYHVVPGKVMAGDVVKMSGATSVNGQQIDIKATDQGVMIDGAKVTATDIQCDNGVIHIIDSVILPSDKTIPETAAEAGTFNTLLAAAKAAGLAETLSQQGPFTVFAPTDEAFGKLPEGTIAMLLKPENKQKLADILKYHVVSGRIYSGDALKAGTAKTLQGGGIRVAVKSGVAMANNAKLVATDVDASNGVIHIVDTVLMPPPAQASMHQMLRNAVATGAPLYNAGDHAACAGVYEQTLHQLMSTTTEPSLRHHMSSVLTSASHQHCPTQRAWTLRHGIDQMFTQLASTR